MSVETVLDSLAEEVIRYSGLAQMAKDDAMERGYKHKARTLEEAMALITERIINCDSE